MPGKTCFITLPKSAVDSGLMSIRSQKALQKKSKTSNNAKLSLKIKNLHVIFVHLLLRNGHVRVVLQVRPDPVDGVVNLGTGSQRVLGLSQGIWPKKENKFG